MRDSGMKKVQVGIEALSSRLLKKLHKGTTVIQNLEIMKNCEALRIENLSNLILHFPGSDAQDVAETLTVLDFAKPFYPLKAVNFWLGMGSPVWQYPKKYAIKALFNHPNWSHIFPTEIYRSLKRIFAKFSNLPDDKILKFLRMMVAKKLMFEENGIYLSLAVRVN